MPSFRTDYLKFDAFSMKDAIVRRLSENPDFTDQLFEDSNLTTIIEVFAYMFELLTYYVNHGASEAMFSDSVLYSNMNRIVKMLGYSPKGFVPAKTSISLLQRTESSNGGVFDSDDESKVLPKYTRFSTGKSDSKGRDIFFSLVNDVIIDRLLPSTSENTVADVVNGRWRLYEVVFDASGVPFETFVLQNIDPEDESSPRFVAHPYVDVFVLRGEDYIEFSSIDDGTVFGTQNSSVGPDDRVFELRVNENKRYELKFGDGAHGEKLKLGDRVYVVYLESNGPDGSIGANVISEDSQATVGISGLDEDVALQMMGLTISEIPTQAELARITPVNPSASSSPVSIETVDDIRRNAPAWFKMGGRLVTSSDYEKFVSETFRNDVRDVLVMNNWDYMTTFQLWLKTHGKLSVDVRNEGFEFVDSCDFNNVYIWIEPKTTIKESVIQDSMRLKKCLTADPKVLTALHVKFFPGVRFLDGSGNLLYDLTDWDPDNEQWIEIRKDQNSFVSAEKLKRQVRDAVVSFFSGEDVGLGKTLDLDKLSSTISSITGVKEIRTAYRRSGSAAQDTEYFYGLSFVAWTPLLISGSDISIVRSRTKLEQFQFPVIGPDDIIDKIKVVSESFGQPSVL